jgi:hypothetical protein
LFFLKKSSNRIGPFVAISEAVEAAAEAEDETEAPNQNCKIRWKDDLDADEVICWLT